MQEEKIPLWKKLGALGLLLVIVLAVVLWHGRFHADFIPLDRSSVGPNIVASILTWAFIVVCSVLLYPPWRRRAHAFIDKKLAPIHEHFQKQKDHNEWAAHQLARMHKEVTGK